MTEPYQIRDFQADDLEGVLSLREQVFPGLVRERERRRWHWEFDGNPFLRPDRPRSLVIEHGGRLVGNYGFVPYDVAIGERVERGLCGIDFCLHPSLQGRGLGQKLMERFLAPGFCDFPFLVVPTAATAHLMRKFHATWIDGSKERCLWVYPCETKGALASSSSMHVREISAFDARHDELFERLRRTLRLLVVRDSRFLNWRYRDYPFARPRMHEATDRDGTLRGLSVFQPDRHEKRGYLMELLYDPADSTTAHALLSTATELCRASGLPQLFALNRLEAVQRELKSCGFEPVTLHVLSFSCRTPGQDPGPMDWYVTPGDGDLLFSVSE